MQALPAPHPEELQPYCFPRANPHADGHTYTDVHVHIYANVDLHAYQHANAHRDADPHTHGYTPSADADPHTHGNSYADPYTDCYPDPHTDGNFRAYRLLAACWS